MARFRKSMAIAMALVMAGSMACMYPVNAGGMQRVYAAEADAEASADENQTADIAASSGLGVAIHTPAQIKTYIENSGSLLTDEVQYKTAYSDKTPYDPGSLTDETLNSALTTLNIVRYIAGLNYNVTLDSSYNEQSQAAALINQINGILSHSPTRPDGMSDSLYALANTGCRHTNLAVGSANLNTCIVNSWMNDSSASNISHVGHRSWCLNPKMGKTGFGAAGDYMAMYSMDSSNSSTIKNIAWPAQNMPVEYFSSDRAWSLFTGQSETSSSVKVTLERKSDGKKWTFSESSSDGYFNVSDYIHNGTIVFRPSDIDGYNDGDVFTVNVTGVKTPVTYTVTFFSIGELGHVHTFDGVFNSTPDFTNMTAEVSAKCDGCDKTFTDSVDITITSSGVSCGYSGSLWYSYKPKFAGKTYSASAMDRVTSLPHLNGEPTFTWNGAECTAAQTCSRCGEVTTTPCTVTSTTTATCTSAGTTTYTATLGKYSSVKNVASTKSSHKYTNYISDDNATCIQDGTKTAECDYGCGTTDTVTDEGSKLEHRYTNYVSNDDATCQHDGTKTAECDYGCGTTDTITNEGSKLEHKYTHYVSNGDATCQHDGTKTAECDYGCGTTDTVTDEGSKLEHRYTNYVSNNDATCQHDGTKTAECDYGCGTTDTVTDAGSKIPHSFTKFVSNDDATCQHDGTKTAECDYGCGETKTVDDVDSPKKSHSFTNYISDNNATCTERGTMTAECDYGCGEKNVILDENSVLADHKYSKYVSDDNATCQHDGTKTAECDYGCGTTKTVTDKGSQLEHTPVGEWIVTRKASPEEDGAMARKCKVCGDTVEGAKIPSIDRMILDSTRFVYDGKAKKTGVIIYDRTGAEIDASQYTLKFEKNTASGRASVKAVFSGDYKGTLTTYFNIMPKGTSVRTLANSTTGVSIAWNKAADGTGYYIYRSTNGGAYAQIAAINKLTTTSYTDKTAKTNGARYLYKVCVYRKNASLILKSSSSAPKTIYYVTAPTCRSAANSAAGSIKVNYTGNTKATGYQIQYALNTKFTGAKTVTAAGYKTTTKVITKLQKNKKYYVRVRGYKKVKGVVYYSAWSTAKSVVVKK